MVGQVVRNVVPRQDLVQVQLQFEADIRSGETAGAGLCVYHQGEAVLDLIGGRASAAASDPWRPETLAVLASPTKALVAVAALLLVDRGELELDVPIAKYWPEFAAEGKSGITLRMLLTHRSGVVALDHDPITVDKLRAHTPIVEALVAARPEWTPDTAHGYHAATFGHLVGELVHRRTGLTVGRFFEREIAVPLGLECHIGLAEPAAAHRAVMVESRAEELMDGAQAGAASALLTALGDPASLPHRATIASMDLSEDPNPVLENPSYDGLASARSLARLFAALIGEVDGRRLLSPALTTAMSRTHSSGICRSLLLPTAWGLGVMVADGPQFPAAAGLGGAFGLAGATGAFVFADPQRELAFAYVPNGGSSVIDRLDPRAERLTRALYGA